MDLELFAKGVLVFIEQKKAEIDINNIGYQTNLIDERVINSFELVELILYLEDYCNKELPITNFKPDNVKTIEALYNSFGQKKGNI